MLSALRADGVSQAVSLLVLRRLEGGRLGEWKEVLDKSETWADLRDRNEALRKEAVEVVEAWGEEPTDGNEPR